jgi:hypothetical protein
MSDMLKIIIGLTVFRRNLVVAQGKRARPQTRDRLINACAKDAPLRPEHVIGKPKFPQQVSPETYLAKTSRVLRVVAD